MDITELFKKRIFGNKRGSATADILQNTVYLILGALAFLFFIYIITKAVLFFWPPPDTNLIPVNSVANNIEFAMNNFDAMLASSPANLQNAQIVAIPIAARLDDGFRAAFKINYIDLGLSQKAKNAMTLQQKLQQSSGAANARQQAIKDIILSIPEENVKKLSMGVTNRVDDAYAQGAALYQFSHPTNGFTRWWNGLTQIASSKASDSAEAVAINYANVQHAAYADLSGAYQTDDDFTHLVTKAYMSGIASGVANEEAGNLSRGEISGETFGYRSAIVVDVASTVFTLGDSLAVNFVANSAIAAGKVATTAVSEAAAVALAKQAAEKVAAREASEALAEVAAKELIAAGTTGALKTSVQISMEAADVLVATEDAEIAAQTANQASQASVQAVVQTADAVQAANVAQQAASAAINSRRIANALTIGYVASNVYILSPSGEKEIGCRPVLSSYNLVLDPNSLAQLDFHTNIVPAQLDLRTQYLTIQKINSNLYVLNIFDGADAMNSYVALHSDAPTKGAAVFAQTSGQNNYLLSATDFCLYKS